MTLPFSVPDWLPWWAIIAILVPLLVWLLAFLVMPFNAFGLRGRLDLIDARLDEIQSEIRALSLRLPEQGVDGFASRPPVPPAPSPALRPRRIEPADDPVEDDPPESFRPRPLRPRPEETERRPPPRTEPRLDWPR